MTTTDTPPKLDTSISVDLADALRAAQAAWGDAIVAIGAAAARGEDPAPVAEALLDELYAFDQGPVLFKPTKARERPFRREYRGALSYFVGGDEAYPEDHGFALAPWVAVRFENVGVQRLEESALAMGHYVFTDPSGAETRVEYSFAYLRDDAGHLRIHLHHSSLPYAP